MILGKIKAAGSVYVINPNGIIFGPTAEINVHSLIASSLDVGNPIMTQGQRDAFFLNTGILGNGSGPFPPPASPTTRATPSLKAMSGSRPAR